jgi:hypothetical protein
MEEETPKLILDDKSYDVDSLDEQQKYILANVQDITNKINELKTKAYQLEVAKEGFVSMLKTSLQAGEENE